MSEPERRETYIFDDAPWSTPPLPGEVVVAENLDELLDRMTADLVVHALDCVRRFGDFHLALSGGEGLEPLFTRLMVDPDCRALPWRRTHLWLVSERCVPPSDERSINQQLAESIARHADIPDEQVHPVAGESPTAEGDYERQLLEVLSWREKGHDRLDYVLLLLGADGSIGGLMPGGEEVRERRRLVRFSLGDPAEPSQVTMTLPLINAARFVSVLAVGPPAAAVVASLAGRGPVDELPARGLAPLNGELRWYLDAEATRSTS